MRKIISVTILLFITGIIMAQTVCPVPAVIKTDTTYVEINQVEISCKDASAISWAKEHLDLWYGELAPKVKKAQYQNSIDNEEGYRLSIGDKNVKIEAHTLKGVRYGLYSLRQLAIPKRGTMKVEGWIAPKTEIEDFPAMDFRGIHICWFPETKTYEIERLIRISAYYKMNYVVIEPWGTFRSKVAPWFGWPDGALTIEEAHRLCSIAKDLGVTLIPQLNVFGHATQSRSISGKHSTLDFNPEYQPLFEPSAGWNWCLSNPNTRKLLSSLIVELLEAFDNPPYFHMGCDEAEPPSCPDCKRRSYSELFLEHMEAMEKVISSHGAKAMMWHDMLLNRQEKKWEGFVHNGTKEIEDAITRLSHDIIICDWYYDGPKENYPTLEHFKNHGFNVLVCPWLSGNGAIALGKQVKEKSLYGFLGTTWHKYYWYNLINVPTVCSNAAWSAGERNSKDYRDNFYINLRQIGWDMKVSKYENTGIVDYQLPNTPTCTD